MLPVGRARSDGNAVSGGFPTRRFALLSVRGCREGASGDCCGDSIIGPTEQCDRGYLLFCCDDYCQKGPAGEVCEDDDDRCTTDVCDGAGACAHPPAPLGTACVAGSVDICTADYCDGAGACIPSRPDADDDGICDALDPCSNDVPITGARLNVLGMTTLSPADDQLYVRAVMRFPASLSPPLDPVRTGALVSIYRGDGQHLFSEILDAGGGWTSSPSGRLFRYLSTGPPLRQAQIRLTRANPARVRVRISVASVPGMSTLPELPLLAVVILAPNFTGTHGLCGNAVFPGTPGPRCEATPDGSGVKCG